MRFLLLSTIFLTACSSQGLKYHYSTFKRDLASEDSLNNQVARIELSLRDERLFVSGMDSTFMVVRLFDKEGNRLTTVDPEALSLSTNEDIKAKPFTFKQGIYRAEILPKVKSGFIKMRVDWDGQVLSEEVELQTSLLPAKDNLIPLTHEYFESKGNGEVNIIRGSGTPENLTDGFTIDNVGHNRIVNTDKLENASRSFQFEYVEQARQNLQLIIEDASGSEEVEGRHTFFMFFPRKQLHTVEQLTGTLNVTLPTGEKVIFQRASKEIVEGVLNEAPLAQGQVPDVKYRGQGLVLKALGPTLAPQLSQAGAEDVIIFNAATGQRCKRPKTDFWEQLDVTPIEFRFAKDDEFERYLKAKCGFGLPKL
jgi:hypothetical protein